MLIKKLEEQEAKAQGKKEENNIAKKIEKHEKKWKMKFIKVSVFGHLVLDLAV